MANKINSEFANNADVLAARATRANGDSATLQTNWRRNEMLVKTLGALHGLSGKGYKFETVLAQTNPDQTGSSYVPPTQYHDVTCIAGGGVLKSASKQTLRIALDMEGRYEITGEGLAQPVTTTVNNEALTTLQGWLISQQGKNGFQCLADMSRAMDRADAAAARTKVAPRNPKAA